jgi:histidyl-tRNA synthetase
MIRLKDTRHSSTADFLSSAIHIAEYYGFTALDEMRTARERDPGRRASNAKGDGDIAYARRDERALTSSAKRCAACMRGLAPEAVSGGLLAWRTAPSPAGIPSTTLELHVLGTGSAVAEALLLVVANAIAEDAGVKDRSLAINNIGSHESSNRFVRDVSAYLRKHIESISPTLRPRAATDPLGTLVQLIERGHPAAPRAPQAMEYLTEDERRKFWELLEYLETYGLDYELTPSVLGSRDCWAHSLFEISTHDEETGGRIAIAFGGRYDPLANRFGPAGTPAAMISINVETRGKTQAKRQSRGLPAMYFAHLGAEARRRALSVMETLRREEIPVHQSLLYDRIGEQMARAKQLAVPYILIMGYKEAMENTILVREVSTNSQEAVPIDDLPGYLKRHRVGMWQVGAKV